MVTPRPDAVLPRTVPHPFSPAGKVDPLPAYRWLQEHAPVYADPVSRAYLVTSHADCVAALRDPNCSAAQGQRGRARDDALPPSMLTTDGAEHQRLRGPGALLLGPVALDAITDGLEAEVDDLLDGCAGPVDVHERLGVPLTVAVYRRLFGLAAGQTAEFAGLAAAAAVNLDPRADPATAAAGRYAMGELRGFLDRHAATAPDCPLRRLVDDAPLERGEVLGILGLAVVGGWQPLAELLPNALFSLLPRPAAIAELARADRTAARVAVDELLRLEAPVPFTARRTLAATALPGGEVPAGAFVLVMLAAGNRDAAVFAHPDDLDLDRAPNPHLGFGSGPHFCLAAPLVRAVGSVVLPRLAARVPRLADPDAPLQWDVRPTMRRLASCRVVLDGRAA